MTDLPDKLETTLTVRLAGEQRKLYAAHEQRHELELFHNLINKIDELVCNLVAERNKQEQSRHCKLNGKSENNEKC